MKRSPYEQHKAGLMLLKYIMIAVMIFIYHPEHASCQASSKDILRQADEARGNLDGVEWKVLVLSFEKGEEQRRYLEIKARGYDFLGVFTSPPKVKSHKILMVDHNMWFIKPGIKKPVPVSPKQKLLGGASYADIAATNYAEDYEATSVTEETIDGISVYVFDLSAVTKKASYERIKYWISKEQGVGIKAEYYTVSEKMIKSALFEYKNTVMIGDEERPFISKMMITDALLDNNITTILFSEPVLKEIPPSTLNLNLIMLR